MKGKLRQTALVALASLALVSCSYEAAQAKRVAVSARPATHATTRTWGYDAVVVCPNGLAEDSLGNLRLIKFDRDGGQDGEPLIVLRCKRFGY